MVKFSVYVDGDFVCTGSKLQCEGVAREWAKLYKRVDIVYNNRLTIRTYLNGKVEG